MLCRFRLSGSWWTPGLLVLAPTWDSRALETGGGHTVLRRLGCRTRTHLPKNRVPHVGEEVSVQDEHAVPTEYPVPWVPAWLGEIQSPPCQQRSRSRRIGNHLHLQSKARGHTLSGMLHVWRSQPLFEHVKVTSEC